MPFSMSHLPICQNTLWQPGSAMWLHLAYLESNQEPIAHRLEMLFSQGVLLVLTGFIVWINNCREMWVRGLKSRHWIAHLQAKWTAWVSTGHCCRCPMNQQAAELSKYLYDNLADFLLSTILFLLYSIGVLWIIMGYYLNAYLNSCRQEIFNPSRLQLLH